MQAPRRGARLPGAPGRGPSLFRVAPAGPAAAQNGTLAGCLSLPGALVLAGEMSLGDCRGDGVKTRCWLGQWKFCAAATPDSPFLCRGTPQLSAGVRWEGRGTQAWSKGPSPVDPSLPCLEAPSQNAAPSLLPHHHPHLSTTAFISKPAKGLLSSTPSAKRCQGSGPETGTWSLGSSCECPGYFGPGSVQIHLYPTAGQTSEMDAARANPTQPRAEHGLWGPQMAPLSCLSAPPSGSGLRTELPFQLCSLASTSHLPLHPKP